MRDRPLKVFPSHNRTVVLPLPARARVPIHISSPILDPGGSSLGVPSILKRSRPPTYRRQSPELLIVSFRINSRPSRDASPCGHKRIIFVILALFSTKIPPTYLATYLPSLAPQTCRQGGLALGCLRWHDVIGTESFCCVGGSILGEVRCHTTAPRDATGPCKCRANTSPQLTHAPAAQHSCKRRSFPHPPPSCLVGGGERIER